MKAICVLKRVELARFENYGDPPNCRHHDHINKRDAVKGIREDQYREVDGLKAVVEQTSNDYVWKQRNSDGLSVKQMVPA